MLAIPFQLALTEPDIGDVYYKQCKLKFLKEVI
jgi:hypothetical protein